MTYNPILEELYAARAQLLANAGGNAHRYLEEVRERERASGRLLTPEELKTIRPNGANHAENASVEDCTD